MQGTIGRDMHAVSERSDNGESSFSLSSSGGCDRVSRMRSLARLMPTNHRSARRRVVVGRTRRVPHTA